MAIKSKFKMHATAAAVVLSLYSVNSYAWFAVTNPTVSGWMAATKTAVTNAVASGNAAIASMIQATGLKEIMAIGEQATAINETTKASMEANAAIADAAAKVDHAQQQQLYATKEMLKQASALRGAPCEEVTASGSTRVAVAGGVVSAATAKFGDASIKTKMASISPQADLERSRNNHEAKYCGPLDPVCDQGVAAPEMQYADVKAESVFFGAGAIAGSNTSSFTPEQVQAAKDYVSNLIKPVSEPSLGADSEKTPQGKAYAQMRRADMARVSLAQLPWMQMIAKKDPTQLPAGISDVAKGAVSVFDPGKLVNPKAAAMAKKGELSYQSMMDTEVDRRYANSDWYESIKLASDPSILLKEMAYMNSLEIAQRHEQLRQMEQLTMIISALYQEQSEATNSPKLAAQRAAAIKSYR